MKPLTSLTLAGTLLSAGVIVAAGSRQSAAPADRGAGIGRTVGTLRAKAVTGAATTVPVAGAKFTVVALTSTTCPLCLRYGPTLARLEDAYAKKGVQFVFVNPESDANGAEVKATIKRLGLNGSYVTDPAWARKLGAKTTTETFVLDAKGQVRYRGAVNDQYSIGAALPKPRHNYLVGAIDALLAGKAPPVASTPAPGCLLALSEPIVAVPAYHGNVEAIVQKNCLSCHREGGVAPFKLDSYAAVKARAPMIKYVVETGIMPPWHAAKGSGPWRNDRTLSEADRNALMTWADKGTPKGDPKRATAPPQFVPGWTIGKPDAVLSLPKPIAIPADGVMPYENVDVPTDFAEDRWVRKIEIVPSDRRVVHHVLVFVRQSGPRKGGRLARLAEATEGLGGFFGGYVPGNSAMVYADGIAKRLPKGAVLRFQIHYTPNGTATTDRTKIGLVFAPKPEHEVRTIGLVNLRFAIPPNAPNHEVTAQITTPSDAEILSFLPHMHLRGKAARYERIAGDGTRSTMLDVPKYDFNWQLNYIYKEPLRINAGDKIVYTAWYDNSEGNRANPDPSKTVHWGEQTFNEMMLGYIEYIVSGQTASRLSERVTL